MIALPDELITELRIMRRDPSGFTVHKLGNCKLGGEQTFVLAHPRCADAGSWCPVHGWIYFNSNQLEPEWE